MNQECIFKKSSSVLEKEDIVPKKEKKKSRQASDSSMVKVLNRNKPKWVMWPPTNLKNKKYFK